ncbi:peroxisomal targeting signal 2 receptor-like [Tropilaelaps mercedesae]|uniref:Peroxisomal targeting signal 2 receptor-like n=1 Tax=Tropilaelaps mercedesae TaxID=418985 RepID=A0A1V9XUL2_9ACAR|nr:peroxisomal targeting signal 2 receptor-like [Tropilaelaps mercedesae]
MGTVPGLIATVTTTQGRQMVAIRFRPRGLRRPSDHSGFSLHVFVRFVTLLWSQYHQRRGESDLRIVCAAAADGNVVLFNSEDGAMVGLIKEHAREACSVEWNPTPTVQLILSASWLYFQASQQLVYFATWAPHNPGLLCCTSGDGRVSLWDIRNPDSHTAIPVW